MTHTKGPWEFKTDSFTGDNGIIAEGTGVFAEAFADIRHAGEGNRAEALANAKLITAAPDLLEALINLVNSNQAEHVAAAIQAISKATA